MMTEELPNGQDQMAAEQEEGEILEDGEIADDEDDIVAVGDYSLGQATATKDEKENKESNQSKFGTFSSYYPLDRDDHFKPHKRKKKNNSKKRKRANSIESKRKLPGDVIPNNNLVDISHCIQDASFDSVELSDEDEFNFDLLDFDVLMEILGCSADRELLDSVPLGDKRNVMLRVVKIMKQLQGNDPDTNRRFARLKRRTRERQNSNSNSGVKPVYNKLICKFYIEGKCHKGSDCNYSHDCVVPKRKELCKFYLQGFCGKGDDCLFMHGEFPCKFFHTNTECYSGEKCRFSHAPLTEDTRDILRSYLDSGTLPDDPKPFRPHYSDWTNNKPFETPDPESAEFDSSFNFETEQLLSKPRPVILGEPTHRMKSSYDTWKWQQELKELEKAYTGLKKNLFCIDEVFAITEKPLTPRIEDDEDEVEAQIMNYYNDMLDTDEIDEMLALQEIEEHQKKAKEEEETMAKTASENLLDSSSATNEISDEEKRLIEASAHDEDLRIIPGMGSTLGSAFSSPPAISSVFDQVNFGTSSNFYPANDGFAPSNPFGDSSVVSAPMESNLDANFPELGAPFGAPSSEITATDVSNMVRQIRNGAGPEPAAPAAAKPEYRDPRLNRIKEPSRVPGSSPNSTFLEKPEEKTVPKPFIKVCNPNVIIDYKLVLIKLSIINYTCYFDLYQNDSALKNDPRLKKFFSSPSNTDQKVATNSDTDFAFSKPKAESDNLIALPSLSIPPIKKSTAVLSPPVPSKILSPLELVSANLKSETESTSSLSLSRDPRIRPKDTDRRRNSDSKVEDVTKTVADLKPLSDMEPEVSSSAAEPSETEGAGAELANETDDLSSIPSYAIAALPSARSLFPSANSNLLFSNLDKLPSPLSASESYSKSSESLDNAHSPSASDEEEEGSLKIQVDIGEEKSDSEPLFLAPTSQDINNWPLNIANNSIDSDNEMEIDLQHHESEVDSENENELIIASSSEPEDNKDCDSQSTDPVSVEDCSLNC